MVILYLRFGAKALQNNFVAELSTHYQNYILGWKYEMSSMFRPGEDVILNVGVPSLAPSIPAEFLSFYGLLNFYLYTLAFVYSPSKNSLYGEWCMVSIEK